MISSTRFGIFLGSHSPLGEPFSALVDANECWGEEEKEGGRRGERKERERKD